MALFMTIFSSKIYASSLTGLLSQLESTAQSNTDVGAFVNAVIDIAIPFSALCVFLLLSFAAYKLMTSRGNPDKLNEAKEQITNAIIGFIFIILSVAILMLLSNILKINISGY